MLSSLIRSRPKSKRILSFMVCLFSFLIVSCDVPTPHLPAISATYPSWVSGCDRFRSTFEAELDRYALHSVLDHATVYAWAYQESLCMTSEELKAYYAANNISGESWRGGLLQVDACWRWGSPENCTTPEQEIMVGFRHLNDSLTTIRATATTSLTPEMEFQLLFFGYNRGQYTAQDAIRFYDHYSENGSFDILGVSRDNGNAVYVACLEHDVCTRDGEWVPLGVNESDPFKRSLYIACRHRFGLQADFRGDYCTYYGYGVTYPAVIAELAERIRNETAPPIPY